MNSILGTIICNSCEKEIEAFNGEQIVTQYGVCEDCNSAN
ncbi:GapA-binding peptide SR1P [Oceanobacillus bengalensis]|uniref:GapA-binding peptide SR1P n=1 Tax=Oceanobacillus bengalensis TaxID=1435466 RepID=A0A494YXD1_9BACI|nr:GapA-binding peptide SR1P [Oceanobacillus bengalensis]